MMESRPRIKIELTKWDKILESFSLAVLLILWLATFASYDNLPDILPVHYNALGKADGYGPKSNIIFLPIVATIIYTGMTILNKYPYIYNYGTNITVENAKGLYTSATKLFRILKLGVVLIFTTIVLITIKISVGGFSGLGVWFLPAAITMLVVPNIYYVLKTNNFSSTSKKH